MNWKQKVVNMSLNDNQLEFDQSLLIRTLPSCDKTTISSVNKDLSAEKTRQKGLDTLNILLDSSTFSAPTVDLLFWINHCMVKYSDDNLRETKLITLRKIVENAHKDQEFNKKFLAEHMSKTLEMCLVTTHVKSFSCEAALQTLSTCMKYYGGWFGHHRERIETFLTTFLDNKNENLVKAAALAFHYLQQVGGAGSDGTNHRNSFSKAFHKLCGTVHQLLDDLFKNENEIANYNRTGEEYYTFGISSVNSYEKKHVLCKQIGNCLLFLETMIRIHFPVAKDTKPKRLLDIILRIMSIHHCLNSDNKCDLELFTNFFTLNKIQQKSLRLLRWTMIWYNVNILPFSYIINKLLIDSLKRTQSCSCFLEDCDYQEIVYNTLNEWIRVSKNSMQSHFQNQLVNCILKDITPEKSEVTLTISTDTNKNVSKKARKRAVQEKIISGKINTECISNSNQKIKEKSTNLALQTLKTLFTNVAVKIEAPLVKQIYTVVLSLLVDIQTGNTVHPYQNSDCLIGLYQVLVSLYDQNTISVYPPVDLSLKILNGGIRSDNRFISSICENGLFALEKFCQPLCPSLYLSSSRVEESEINERVLLNVEDLLDDDIQPNEVSMKCSKIESEASPDYLIEEQHTQIITNSNENCEQSDETDIEVLNGDVSNCDSDNCVPSESLSNGSVKIIQDVSVVTISEEFKSEKRIENVDKIDTSESEDVEIVEGPPPKKTKLGNVDAANDIIEIEMSEEIFDFQDDFVDEVREY